jgi:hypothetical protein
VFKTHPINPELEKVTKYTITSKVSLLRTHFKKIENIFQEESELLWKECEFENARTKDHEDDSGYDYRSSDSLREIEFIYLRMHRYSAILTAYSYLESSMNKLCDDFEEKMSISLSASDLNGNGIARCKMYLERLATINFSKINKEWSHLTTLNKLRNCIIHADGDASKIQRSGKFITLIQNSSDLSFIEKNLVMVSSDFVYKSIDEIENTLLYLVEHVN